MQKCHFGNFSEDWLDWSCPVCAALQNGSHDFFFSLLYLFFFQYETIVKNSTRSFGHSDPEPSSMVWSINHASSHAILCFANCFKKMGGGIVCLLMTINVNYSFVRKISEGQGKATILKVRAKKYC